MKAFGVLCVAGNPWPSTLTGRTRGPGERPRTPLRALRQKEARTARDVALAYYENYNNKDIDGVLQLIAKDVVYEDLIYQEPFRGRDAVKAYFEKIERLVPKDIKFVVEDITDGDPKRVGVRWHVELDGVAEFPFSRGVSFYEINDQGQIKFARDIVEPTLKPGAAALGGISLVAPLVRQLHGTNAESLSAFGMAGFYASYIAIVLLSPFPPGLPAWQTTPDTIARVVHESFNFFYVNIALATVNMNPVPNVAEHPVDEALFNFVNAWSLMMWPLWVADPRGQRVKQKPLIWLGTMFLTNVFLPLYMTLRLVPDVETKAKPSNNSQPGLHSVLPRYSPAFGLIALFIGCLSLGWAAFGRPEYGGLDARLVFLSHQFSTDRVFWAFCIDFVLYYIWQIWLMGACKAGRIRFVPFFGMALWLLNNKSSDTSNA